MKDEKSELLRTIKAQEKCINELNVELELLKKECLLLNQFPIAHLNLLKRCNGITHTGHVICFISYKGYKFGVIAGELARYYSTKSEARLKVNFEASEHSLEIKGNLFKTQCGIVLLDIKETSSPKLLQDHSLTLPNAAARHIPSPGAKLVAYVPHMELATGFTLSAGVQEGGEIKCQLVGSEEYVGSLVLDEGLMPAGVCAGMGKQSMVQTAAKSIELSSAQPLTIKVVAGNNCRVVGIEAIIKEIEPIVSINTKEEFKLSDEVENGITPN